jgi:hypothetical protein
MDFRIGQEQISVLDYKYKPWKYMDGMRKVMEVISFMITRVQARNYIHDLTHNTEFVFNTL